MNPFSQLPALKKDSKNGAARKSFGPSYSDPALGQLGNYFHSFGLVLNNLVNCWILRNKRRIFWLQRILLQTLLIFNIKKSGLELFLTNRSPDWPRESMSGFLSSSRKTLAAAKTALL